MGDDGSELKPAYEEAPASNMLPDVRFDILESFVLSFCSMSVRMFESVTVELDICVYEAGDYVVEVVISTLHDPYL